jgi:YihY family inner membrane protein
VRNRLFAVVLVFRDAGLNYSLEAATFFAQAIAFSALFAIIPLALLIVAMFGYIFGTADGLAYAVGTMDAYAPQLHGLVSQGLASAVRYRGISGLVGLAGLAWSAKNVFGALSFSLDRALGVPSRHFILEIVIALILIPIVGLIILIATAIPIVISFVVHFTGLEYLRFAPQIASYATSLVLVFILTALVYAYLPNRPSHFRFGVPGAIVTAIGYSIIQVTFAVYTTHTNVLEIYGTLSTVFAVMLWIYLNSALFLYGAHFSSSWEARFDAR